MDGLERLEREAAEDRVERIASLACDLLDALQPWQMHSQAVRSAATRLTVGLAALPLPRPKEGEA